MFCYTSGTTGDPKGALIPHHALIGGIYTGNQIKMAFQEGDINISYLPYGHLFEAAFFIFSVIIGFAHGYYSGDPLLLLNDL